MSIRKNHFGRFALFMIMFIAFSPPIAGYAACPDNMIAHWELDETAAGTYADMYSNNEGAGAANPVSVAGQIGGAQEFNGTTMGITTPAPTNPYFTWSSAASFSIELWVKLKTDDLPSDTQVFIGRYDSPASSMQWYVGTNASHEAVFRLVDRSGGVPAPTQNARGGDLSDGEWHHVVAVRDNSTNQNILYVDGAVVATIEHDYTAGFTSSSAEITIGWFEQAGVSRFSGSLDEVAIYNAALSADDVLSHYQAGGAGTALCPSALPFPDDTLAVWNLDEETPASAGATYADAYLGHEGIGDDNPIATTEGRVAGAQEFDAAQGTGITVAADNSFLWSVGASFSIELWVKLKTDDLPSGAEIFIGRYDAPTTSMQWYVGTNASSEAVFRLVDRGGNTPLNAKGGDLSDGEWHHIVAVRDGSAGENILYVDGAVIATQPFTYTLGFGSTTAEITIGWFEQGAYGFSGYLDEIAIYGAALSPAEIARHYDAGVEGNGINTLRPAPTAVAAVDGGAANVQEETEVTLTGSGSTAGYDDAEITGYLWEQIDSSGVDVTLTDANTVDASFTAPAVDATALELTFRLTVTASDGQTATDEVTVNVVDSSLPIAVAQVAHENVTEGDEIILDGSGSSDSDGTIETYAWVQTVGPSVDLTGANTSQASFTAPDVEVGGATLTFELTVTDNDGFEGTDTVTINVGDSSTNPIADAGVDQTINENRSVTLDGSGSSASGTNTIVSYTWEQTDSTGVTVDLSGADPTEPTFTFTAPSVSRNTTLTFRLTVEDNEGRTANDSVDIEVNNTDTSDGGGGGGGCFITSALD